MNKSDLANKILALEGLSNEDKSALLGLLREHKKYGLVWEDKPEEVEKRLETELPVLREVADRAIISDNPDAPNHILIEGDNLEALSALSYTHAGKIDVIYIDPPYNTGKEFIYNDNLIDRSDDFSHSFWLSFMSRRLKIAHKLLKTTGVILISIDDNEHSQLKMLCDEIFKQSNFIADFCVIRAEGGGMAKQVIKGHDYCLGYAKDVSVFRPLGRPKDIRGKVVTKNGIQYWIQEDWLRKEFGKYGNCHYEEIVQYKGEDYKREIDDGIKHGLYVLIPKSNGMNIVGKLRRVDDDCSKFYSILKFLNKDGVNELKEIGVKFDYPKPLGLIFELVRGASIFNKRATILDFFAGSGTTLHATMQLNAEDGGHRTCILCTNNENGICENVTYERNKRVIEGYTTPKNEHVAGLTDNNLRYYRTELLPQERTNKNMRELVKASTGLLCIKNDLYMEAPFAGRRLNANYARFFEHGDKRMLVIYNEQAIPFIVDILKEMPGEGKIKVYVFAYGSDPYEADFADVKDRVTLCALPDAIYNAYKKVLPKHKPKFSVDGLVEEIIVEEEAEATAAATLDFNNGYNREGGEQ